jgi:hypothetical protein
MEVGVQAIRILVGDASDLEIRLHHLGRLPLLQQMEQRAHCGAG